MRWRLELTPTGHRSWCPKCIPGWRSCAHRQRWGLPVWKGSPSQPWLSWKAGCPQTPCEAGSSQPLPDSFQIWSTPPRPQLPICLSSKLQSRWKKWVFSLSFYICKYEGQFWYNFCKAQQVIKDKNPFAFEKPFNFNFSSYDLFTKLIGKAI